jgi:hypothetical protein
MKAAIIFSSRIVKLKCFVWRWRSQDPAHESTQSFIFYADCVADAQRNGYKVGPRRVERVAANPPVASVGSAGKRAR